MKLGMSPDVLQGVQVEETQGCIAMLWVRNYNKQTAMCGWHADVDTDTRMCTIGGQDLPIILGRSGPCYARARRPGDRQFSWAGGGSVRISHFIYI